VRRSGSALGASSGALIAEVALYWCGLQYGQRFLALLCKLSFSSDFCVRRTEQVFARVGSWSLLFAKFIPGLSLIAVAMAGVTKMPVLPFLLLDGISQYLPCCRSAAIGSFVPNPDSCIAAKLHLHSITSSARAMSVGGTSKLIAHQFGLMSASLAIFPHTRS
jgi:membrane protein DedA with SNARE-associated domain